MNPFMAEDARLITTAVRDATAQVEAEERIREINAELERRVADRTVALTRSNDALRQFAWASSHDLQEPVRTVLAYSQWLAQHAADRLDDKATRMLQTIEMNAEHMHGLLGALRQYIFISESTDEQMKPVDSNVALRAALFNVDSLVQETQAVDRSPGPADHPFPGDRDGAGVSESGGQCSEVPVGGDAGNPDRRGA